MLGFDGKNLMDQELEVLFRVCVNQVVFRLFRRMDI
jgi:hypothetical protein